MCGARTFKTYIHLYELRVRYLLRLTPGNDVMVAQIVIFSNGLTSIVGRLRYSL